MTFTKIETVVRIIKEGLNWHVLDKNGQEVKVPNKNLARLLGCYRSKLVIVAAEPLPRVATDAEIALWGALQRITKLYRESFCVLPNEEEEEAMADAERQVALWEAMVNTKTKCSRCGKESDSQQAGLCSGCSSFVEGLKRITK